MKRIPSWPMVIVAASLAIFGTRDVYAQDKYSLISPGGIAFSDFKGYEDWSVVSSARTDEVLKVIVANPPMIEAYKAGVPGNGQPFPDGSKIVKLQWRPKKGTEAPFVPDVIRVPCGREGEGPHLPRVPEALNRVVATWSTRPSPRDHCNLRRWCGNRI